MLETPELSPSAVRAAHEVRVVVGRLRRRLRESHQAGELTLTQTSLLSRLEREGPRTASDLAAAEGIRPQSVAASTAVCHADAGVSHQTPHDQPRPQDAPAFGDASSNGENDPKVISIAHLRLGLIDAYA